jgi:hypothetical protein
VIDSAQTFAGWVQVVSLDASFGGGYSIGAIIFLEEMQSSQRARLAADIVIAPGIGPLKAFALFRGMELGTAVSVGGNLMLYKVAIQNGG